MYLFGVNVCLYGRGDYIRYLFNIVSSTVVLIGSKLMLVLLLLLLLLYLYCYKDIVILH